MTAAGEAEDLHDGLVPQLRMMVRALLRSPVGRTLVSLMGAILIVIIVTAYGQIRLNRWNQPFYDALSRRDFSAFLYQLAAFFVITGGLLVLNVAQRWLVEMLKLRLREGLVRDLVRDWMQPGRALALAHSGAIGINPDQRMHEDARRLCELSADLGTGLLQASVLLVTFIGVLWGLSVGFELRVAHHDYRVPGYMVWAAFLYAAFGSLLSYWVGSDLIARNADRYAREADLRFSLVRVNEHLDDITLAGGEAGEAARVELRLDEVLLAMRRLVTGLTNLTWVTAGFGWVTLVAPILVAAPLYFSGSLSFGGLMMASAAFTQVQSSLRWFVDNFSTIADWRATLLRVASFRRAVTAEEVLAHRTRRIHYDAGDAPEFVIEGLEIIWRSGHDRLAEQSVRIRAGERVLVVTEAGTNKTLLFRALAGLWPFGAGHVVRPRGQPIVYLPRGTPYLPRGTLREVLAYPEKTGAFEESAFEHALQRFELGRLVPMLDEMHRWDRELSGEEQLSLAFVRILLKAPAWVIVDDTLGSLDGQTLERVLEVFEHELAHTGVIHVGSAQARDTLFPRTLHLVRAGESGADADREDLRMGGEP